MPLLEDLLITLLFGTQASFTHPGILIPTVESTGDAELKNVVKQTQRSRDARETLGFSPKVWRTMTETLRAGNDELQGNKHHLLPKVWDLAILARNLLAAKEKAQNLAASEGFEAEIRRLLSICVEKTSKPVPPNLDKTAHDKELQMKGGYKKVLITSLQFLNNLMTQNETRKLHLWLHLFGTPSSVTNAAPITHQNGSGGSSGSKNKGKNKSKQPQTSAKSSPNSNNNNNSSSSSSNNNNNNSNNNNSNNNNNEENGFAGTAIGTGVAPHSETAQKCNSLSAGFNAKYYKPGFLTDVPRLLQPDEIEPLLMILQSGVVAFEGTDEAMQAVRCKLMLAQGYGRSLLRETLVFLGAWEVDEEDFCYRVLGQVVESILINGLIPYAYECFRDEKDVVTPAQSSLLKLLVSVYRPQPALPNPTQGEWVQSNSTLSPLSYLPSLRGVIKPPYEYDEPPIIEASIPTFFVNVFRKQVLGPVLSVIRLQGAIRRGEEPKERFELSLWDLDRIYEGVYQFMELFVLFSEDEDAKRVLHANNDALICDFVKLLGELDQHIPRYVASKDKSQLHRDTQEKSNQQLPIGRDIESTMYKTTHKVTVESKFMVERPFDIDDGGDGDNDLDYDDADDDHDDQRDMVDPDEFTWPNIKRFLVILISSLAWHNSNVQDTVRKNGGVEVVLNQCKIDDDNPYIREHAILCIRSLLQGNPANQKIVEELNARETVPSEVLDKHGYEPYIDEKGRVKLKRTEDK